MSLLHGGAAFCIFPRMGRTLEHVKYAAETSRVDLCVELVLGGIGGTVAGWAAGNAWAGIGAGVGTAVIVWGGFFLVRLLKAPNEIAANDRGFKDDAYKRVYKENILLKRAKNVARKSKNDPLHTAAHPDPVPKGERPEPRTDHPALFEIQRLFADISAAINTAAWLIEHLFADLLSDHETQDDVRACKKSLEALAAALSNRGGADDVQDSIYTLYVDYQRVREWIAEGLRQGGDSLGLEPPQELQAWHEADQFLDALTRLTATDPFARLARKLRFYVGPNPQFGFKTLPPTPGATLGLFAFGLIGEPGESKPLVKGQEAIEQIRVLWQSPAKLASRSAYEFLARLKHDSENQLALLLQTPLDDLKESREAMRALVRDESPATLTEISQGFGEFHRCYRAIVALIHKMEDDGTKITVEPYTSLYYQWAEHNKAFRVALNKVLARSDATELRKGLEDHSYRPPKND